MTEITQADLEQQEDRRMPQTGGLLGKTKRLFGGRGLSDEEVGERDLVRVNSQLRTMRRLLNQDRETLEELAKNDNRVADLLETVDDEKISPIVDKVLDRESITKEEANALIDNLKDITGQMEGLNHTLETNLGEVVEDVGLVVKDQRVDVEQRRKVANELADFAEQQLERKRTQAEKRQDEAQLQALQQQQASLDDLKSTLEENQSVQEFSKNQEEIVSKLDNLRNTTLDTKIYTSLENLDKTMDASVLNQEELNNLLDRQMEDGKTFGAYLRERGSGFLQERGGNILSTIFGEAFSAVGLGGLEGPLGDIATQVGSLGVLDWLRQRREKKRQQGTDATKRTGRSARARGGFFGRALGKVGGRGLLRLLGRAAGIGTVLFGIADAVEGFRNPEEIVGLEKGEKASLLDRINAARANIASGITLGIVSPETIYELEQYLWKIVNGELIGEMVKDLWGWVRTHFSEYVKKAKNMIRDAGIWAWEALPEDATSFINKRIDQIGDAVGGVWDTVQSSLGEWFDSLKNYMSGLPKRVKDKISGFLPSTEGISNWFDRKWDQLWGDEESPNMNRPRSSEEAQAPQIQQPTIPPSLQQQQGAMMQQSSGGRSQPTPRQAGMIPRGPATSQPADRGLELQDTLLAFTEFF